MLITFSSPKGSTGSSIFFDIKWKPIFFLIVNPIFQLQILCSFGDITKSVKLNGIPENNFFMYFHDSLISRGAYFLLLLESKQEATSGWNFTKCISEVKVNQLKVKNMLLKWAYPPLNMHDKVIVSGNLQVVQIFNRWMSFWCQNLSKHEWCCADLTESFAIAALRSDIPRVVRFFEITGPVDLRRL